MEVAGDGSKLWVKLGGSDRRWQQVVGEAG